MFDFKMPPNLLIICGCLISSLDYAVSSKQEPKIEFALEKDFLSLVQNVSELRKDVVAANIIQAYLTQEISFKNELKAKLEELSQNNSLLQERNLEQERRLEDLSSNYTGLQQLHTQSTTEQHRLELQLRELVKNNSALQIQYSAKVKEQEQKLTILQYVVEGFRQNLSIIGGVCKNDLQNIHTLNQKQSHLENDFKQLSMSLAEVEHNEKSINNSLWKATEQLKQSLTSVKTNLLFNISSLHTDLDQYKSARKFLCNISG